MTLRTTCHCGAVRITVPQRPAAITNCNCSVCRRYGVLWGYYTARRVQVDAPPGGLQRYRRADKATRWVDFVRCAACGCVTHWERIVPAPGRRMGVNMRNFTPEQLGPVRIRRLDGAVTERYLDE